MELLENDDYLLILLLTKLWKLKQYINTDV